MIDKILAVPRAKCGGVIGRVDRESLKVLNQKLILIMGLSDFES
jgi:mRNA interferase MazF